MLLPLLATTLGSTVVMMAQDPVPTRIRADITGAASGTPLPVKVAIDLRMSTVTGAEVRLSNAIPGAAAVLVFGTRPAAISLPFNGVLLVEPIVALPGIFDASGAFGIPVDLADKAMLGQVVLAQGLQFVPAPIVFQMTPALGVSHFAGNPQPPLAYIGPPLTATAVLSTDPMTAPRHEVMASFVVPTTGWDVRLQSIRSTAGVTSAYLVLEQPGPDEFVMPVLQTLRLCMDLGDMPQPRFQIGIEQRVRGTPTPPFFALAAEIDLKF